MKVIDKDDNSDNDGSSSNDDNYVKDYGDNYGDTCILIMKSMMIKMIMMMIIVITMLRQ